MLDLNQYTKNFNGLTLPDTLIKLLAFQNKERNYYADGFALIIEDKAMLKTYSEDEKFLSSFVEFAQADGTGSIYSFWLRNNNTDLNKAPIIVFGSEGGYHIVAENLKALMQILTYDAEPMVDWDRAYFYKDEEDYEPTPRHKQYVKWLADNFNISPIQDAGELVGEAQDQYQDELVNFVKTYYAE